MCWHFSLRTYSVDATTALRTCFLLLHKPAKCCVSFCFLTRNATTKLRLCFVLCHKSAKCCVFFIVFSHERRPRTCALVFSYNTSPPNVAFYLCFLIRKTTTDLRTCFLLWHKSGKCVVFPLFSHTKDDHGLADLFSLMAQVRQMLRFPSVFSHERRPRTCGLVFSYGTSPAHVAFSLCFHTRKTPADLRTCFLLKELICF